MRKSRFGKAHIVSILREADAGRKVADVDRKHGVSEATYYKWRTKYFGLEASELTRIKALGAENAKLKKMYAEMAVFNEALRELIKKLCGRSTGAKPSARWSGISKDNGPEFISAKLVNMK